MRFMDVIFPPFNFLLHTYSGTNLHRQSVRFCGFKVIVRAMHFHFHFTILHSRETRKQWENKSVASTEWLNVKANWLSFVFLLHFGAGSMHRTLKYTRICAISRTAQFHRWGSLTRCHKATMFPVRILIALFPLQLAIETLHAIVINRTLKPETILAFSVHTMHCVAMANSQRRLCIEQRPALCLHLLLSNYSSFVIINLRSAQT